MQGSDSTNTRSCKAIESLLSKDPRGVYATIHGLRRNEVVEELSHVQFHSAQRSPASAPPPRRVRVVDPIRPTEPHAGPTAVAAAIRIAIGLDWPSPACRCKGIVGRRHGSSKVGWPQRDFRAATHRSRHRLGRKSSGDTVSWIASRRNRVWLRGNLPNRLPA